MMNRVIWEQEVVIEKTDRGREERMIKREHGDPFLNDTETFIYTSIDESGNNVTVQSQYTFVKKDGKGVWEVMVDDSREPEGPHSEEDFEPNTNLRKGQKTKRDFFQVDIAVSGKKYDSSGEFNWVVQRHSGKCEL